jgi:hypothetical protein
MSPVKSVTYVSERTKRKLANAFQIGDRRVLIADLRSGNTD